MVGQSKAILTSSWTTVISNTTQGHVTSRSFSIVSCCIFIRKRGTLHTQIPCCIVHTYADQVMADLLGKVGYILDTITNKNTHNIELKGSYVYVFIVHW